MGGHEREPAERRQGDRRVAVRRADSGGDIAATAEIEFLEKTVWALDGLSRHADKHGHPVLAKSLSAACDAARAELEAALPRPAQVASARMRALWLQEGRAQAPAATASAGRRSPPAPGR